MLSLTSVACRIVPPTAGRARTFPATVAFAALAILVSYLPFSAMNGVLGTVGAAAGVATAPLQWVTNAFTIALTVSLLLGGALAQRYGARRVVVAALILTALSCLVGWSAGDLDGIAGVHVLQAGQALAGVAAGISMAAGLALIAGTAPDSGARTRAISLWAAANVAGLGAGPFLSGAVTSVAPWYWTYVPLALLALTVAAYGAGAALAGLPATGDGVARLAGRLVAQAPRLFAVPGFAAAGLAAAMVLFTVIGVVFQLSIALHARQVGELGIAVRLGFLFAGNALASVASGPLQRRFGPRAVLLGGLVVVTLALVALLGVHGTGVPQLAWRLALVGLGAGLVIATATAFAVQTVPGPLAPAAGTMHNAARQFGGALGPAILGGASLHVAVLVLVALLVASTTSATLLLVRQS